MTRFCIVWQRRVKRTPSLQASPHPLSPSPHTNSPTMAGQWKSGLFEINADCCLGCICSCISVGQLAADPGAPEGVCCKGNLYGACCLHCICMEFDCCCLLPCIARGAIRAQQGIEGNACTDCLLTTFCLGCSLAQVGHPGPSPRARVACESIST